MSYDGDVSAKDCGCSTGIHRDSALRAWVLCAFGVRIAWLDAVLVKHARIDLLAPWNKAASMPEDVRDVACVVASVDDGRSAGVLNWKWVKAMYGGWSIKYHVPDSGGVRISGSTLPTFPHDNIRTAELRSLYVQGKGEVARVGFAPEIRTVFWYVVEAES